MAISEKNRVAPHKHLSTDVIGGALQSSQRTNIAESIIWEIINEAPSLTNLEILNYIWSFDNNGVWLPINLTFPTGGNQLRFKDNLTANYFDVSLITSKDNYDNPLLVFSQGLVVKKDISVGGFLASNQGAIAIGYGLTWVLDTPHIWLYQSGTNMESIVDAFDHQSSPPSNPESGHCYVDTDDGHIYWWNGSSWIDKGLATDFDGRYFDTLFITKANYVDLAHVRCANIAAHNINPVTGNTYGLGSPTEPWLGICTTTVYTENLKHLNGDPFGTWNGGTVTENIAINKSNPTLNLNISGSNKVSITHNATDAYIDIATGRLIVGSYELYLNHASEDPRINLMKNGGERIFLGHDGTDSHLSARYGSLILTTVTNPSNIYIRPVNGTVYFGYTSNPTGIMPYIANEGNVGSDTQYWGSMWANYLKYHTTCTSFDMLDDLSLVKNYKLKKEHVNGVEIDVIDFENSFPFLIDKKGFKDQADITGFLLGCIKQLVIGKDVQDTRIKTLEEKLEQLEKRMIG